MKKENRFFQILYPILIYFIVYQLGVSFLIDIIGDKYGKLTCLLIAGIVCIIPIFLIYKSIPEFEQEPLNFRLIIKYIIWIIAVTIIAILLNIFLTRINLAEQSNNFDAARETLTDGSFVIKMLCNCLVVPILEELLVRGIITRRLYMWYGTIPAVIISSIFFGIIHNNIVQFIYATVIGIGLSIMYLKNKRLSLCIITHCLINFIVIVFS